MTNLERITRQMNILEVQIAREQNYITKFGEANDKDSDFAWESYKINAAYNLEKWDMLKLERDRIKAQA